MQSTEHDILKYIPSSIVILETRFACTEGWFLRARWENKVNFMNALVKVLKEPGVNRLISEIVLIISKDSVYCENSKTDSFDNVPHDDDRELDEATLQYMMKEDLVWFAGLNAEEELNIVTGLIRLGGIQLARKALDALHTRLYKSGKTRQFVNEVLSRSPLLLETQKDGIERFKEKVKGKEKDKDSKTPIKKVKQADKSDTSWKIVHSPVVQAAMLSWTSEMTNMQTELRNWDPHEKFKAANTSQFVDILQTLPIWSTKYFARMLPNQTQKEMKKMNPYWQMVVDQANQEQSVRGFLTKTLTKSLLKQSKTNTKMQKLSQKKSKEDISEDSEDMVDNVTKPRTNTIVKLLDQSNFQYGHVNTDQYCIINVCERFNSSLILACCPKSGILAVTTPKRSIALHSLLTGSQLITPLTGHLGTITCLCFHPDGDKIFSGSSDLTVRWWDIWTQKNKRVYLGHEKTVTGISVSQELMASAGLDKKINVYQIYSGLKLVSYDDIHPFTCIYIESSPKQRVFCGNDHGDIIIYNNETQMRKCSKGHNKSILTMYMSTHILLTGSFDGYVKVWNKHKIGKCLLSLNNRSPVHSITLSCHQIITGLESGYVNIWCICKGTLLQTLLVKHDLRPILQVLTTQNENTPANIVVGTDSSVQILDYYQGDEEFRHVYHTKCHNSPNKISEYCIPLCQWAPKKAITEILMNPELFKHGFLIQESNFHKRTRKTILRGCTDKKLRSNLPCNSQKSVFLQALQETQQLMPSYPLTSFPRSNYEAENQ